jgi:hypothetical protein
VKLNREREREKSGESGEREEREEEKIRDDDNLRKPS